jgi:hypothetical protein
MSWFGGWFGPEAAAGAPAVSGARGVRDNPLGLEAGALLQSARDLHPGFDRQRHPDGTLLRALSGEERRLVGKALQANPSSITGSLSFALADYDFDAGAALPAFHHIETVDAIPSDAAQMAFPLLPVAWPNRAYLGAVQGYSIQANTLYLTGDDADWSAIGTVVVTYTPIPVDLTALTDRLVIPDTAEAALVAFLAHFMARRLPATEMPIEELSGFAKERTVSEGDFLRELESLQGAG